MSCGRRSHFASGWRRTTPEALHGTSARMRSNGVPSHQSSGRAASPTAIRPRSPSRSKFSAMRRVRGSLWSSASRSSSARSSRCDALPPGAAQASSTRWPAATSSSAAARWAPRSCTDSSPSAKPGRRDTGQGLSSSRPSSPRICASMPASCSRASACCGVVRRRFARSAIGGWLLPCAAMSCHCPGWSRRSMSSHHCGCCSRAAGSAATAASSSAWRRCALRSTAFISPPKRSPPSARAASTAWFTVVCAESGRASSRHSATSSSARRSVSRSGFGTSTASRRSMPACARRHW